jgi:hypothetical protein
LDQGSDANIITREWIEQIINSRIQPRVSAITIKPIPLAAGGVAYVIDIPQATSFAPHQADNHRYYRRFNFQSVPMEDYEVKDALRRSTTGDPYMKLSWSEALPTEKGVRQGRLKVHVGNLAAEPILYALLRVYLDRRIVPADAAFPHWEVNYNAELEAEGNSISVVRLSRNILPTNHMPIFREATWLMVDVVLPVPSVDDYIFHYTIVAPGVDAKFSDVFRFDGYEMTSLAFPPKINS